MLDLIRKWELEADALAQELIVDFDSTGYERGYVLHHEIRRNPSNPQVFSYDYPSYVRYMVKGGKYRILDVRWQTEDGSIHREGKPAMMSFGGRTTTFSFWVYQVQSSDLYPQWIEIAQNQIVWLGFKIDNETLTFWEFYDRCSAERKEFLMRSVYHYCENNDELHRPQGY